jgi:pyruvate dehydrogenase E2 component (dihydrolipoamide acetyltransferase)
VNKISQIKNVKNENRILLEVLDMAVLVKMPKVGLSDESAIIAKWHKKKGEKVKAGEVLFTIETDKSTFEVEAETDGVLLDIFFDEGEEVPVLKDVAVIGMPGEDISNIISPHEKTDSEFKKQEFQISETQKETKVIDEEPHKEVFIDTKEEKIIKISPRARNLAEKMGLDFRLATPTGPEGRIIERDILSLVEKGPVFTQPAREHYTKSELDLSIVEGTGIGGRITTSDLERLESQEKLADKELAAKFKEGIPSQLEYEEVRFTNIRRIIAKNMIHSLSTTAQLTINITFDATEILALREKIKANKDKYALENITLNDMILYAVSRTLLNYPELNAHLVDETMLLFKNVHLGVAVDTDRGLMVPTLFNANLKSLNQISKEAKELADQCRKGSINPDYLKNGTFTVTNLGTLDVEHFTPILNPPQTGILGVCAVTYRPRLVNGQYEFYPAMGLSLTFDHRAVDGAPAARFLKELKTNLENFSLLLTK